MKLTAYSVSPEVKKKLSAFPSLLHLLSPRMLSMCLRKVLPSDNPTIKRRNETTGTPQVIQTEAQRKIPVSK